MLFDTLFYLNLLRHCQRLTHYCNVTTRIGWNWYVFTVKLLNVCSISFISSMSLLISSTARFEFLHLCRWRCVLHLWTWKEFLGKCRNQQFHINLALQVVSLWLNSIIDIYIYIIYISTLYNSQAVVSWTKQWSQTCWCSICSCLSFFATCTHLNWLIQNISLSRCCRFRGRVSNLLGSILGSEARHPSFPPAATPSAMPPGGVGLMDPSTIDIWSWLYYEYVTSTICYCHFSSRKKQDLYHARVIYYMIKTCFVEGHWLCKLIYVVDLYISYWNGGRTMRVETLRVLAGGVSITSINRETNIDEIIEEVLILWIGLRYSNSNCMMNDM